MRCTCQTVQREVATPQANTAQTTPTSLTSHAYSSSIESHRIPHNPLPPPTPPTTHPQPNQTQKKNQMAGLTPLAQTARRRPKPAGDEEAGSVLKLGEMANSAALSTAAAYELLLKIEEARAKDPKLPLTHNDLIIKNNAYLNLFARHKGSDMVQQVTSEAETLTQLAEFERAQLGGFFSFPFLFLFLFCCLAGWLRCVGCVALVDGWMVWQGGGQWKKIVDWTPSTIKHGRFEEKPRLTREISTGSLCCDTAEEARTLIPSLEGKITDEDLQVVLDNIAKLRFY